jgi:hypothetical protein
MREADLRKILLGLAAILGLVPPVFGATLQTQSIGQWTLGAFSNDQSGEFSHCAGVVPYQSGITMAVSINRDYRWSVAFFSPNWQLSKGASYAVALSIDAAPAIPETAIAISDQLAEVALPDNMALFNNFRHGQRLRVDSANRTFYFSLAGTNAVLTSLLKCVEGYKPAPQQNRAGDTQQAAAPQRTDPGLGGSDQNRAEATALAANILSISGVTGFHMLTPAEIPPSLRVDAAWRMGSVFGAINVVTVSNGLRLRDLPPLAISGDAKSCHGKFASGALPDGTDQMIRVFTSCESADTPFTVYYAYAVRPRGGFYRFLTMTQSTDAGSDRQTDPLSGKQLDLSPGVVAPQTDGGSVEVVDETLRQAFVKVLSRP